MQRFYNIQSITSPIHLEAMLYLNELTLTVKVKQNGEKWDNLPELNGEYLSKWQEHRASLFTCKKMGFSGNIIEAHRLGVQTVDSIIDKLMRGEKLTVAEIRLLEDIYQELEECREPMIRY